jgi:hypothetical protein
MEYRPGSDVYLSQENPYEVFTHSLGRDPATLRLERLPIHCAPFSSRDFLFVYAQFFSRTLFFQDGTCYANMFRNNSNHAMLIGHRSSILAVSGY